MTRTDTPYTAVVLAASRGSDDPVARLVGLPSKVLAPLAGAPMLAWVLRALERSQHIARIVVSVDDPSLLDRLRSLPGIGQTKPLLVVASGAAPSSSVLRALDAIEDAMPVLLTTGDHPLLTPAMIDHFCAVAPSEADVAVALAPASLVRRAYPGAVRTYYRFAGEGYSGCNLFSLRTPAARQAVAFWAKLERHRKRPWRLLAAIGPFTLARFLLGRLTLETALRRLSKLSGATVRAVEMPFAEAAIDVDKPADLVLAEAILVRS